jgi:hypothetical protein
MADVDKELEQLLQEKEALVAKEREIRASLKVVEKAKAKEAIAGFIGSKFPAAGDVSKVLGESGFAKLEVVYSIVDGQPTMDYTPKSAGGGGGDGARGPIADLKGIFDSNATAEELDAMQDLENNMPRGTKEEKAAYNRSTYQLKKKVQKRVESGG